MILGKTLDNFREIKNEMLWKTAALNQLDRFEQLAGRLGVPLAAVGSHHSKSIELPVVRLVLNDNTFLLRDNFNDINLCVLASSPVLLPLADLLKDVCRELDWDWYLDQIAKCRGYSWREWTDEQMDNPELLQLTPDAPWFTIKQRDEKVRWLRRMTDPSWFSHDWSSGAICYDGTFGPGVKIFVQQHPFAEGISKLVDDRALEPYSFGRSRFAFAVGSLNDAEKVIRRVAERKDK